jgi:hypothetical protein
MTSSINQAIKEALDLVRSGFAPDEAVDMTLQNTAIERRRRWSNSEQERIREGVWSRDPRGKEKRS